MGIELTPESKDELFKILNEMKTGYADLQAKITAGQPTGEVKTLLSKIDESLITFQTKHTEAIARMDSIERTMADAAAKAAPVKGLGELVTADAGILAAIKQGGRFAVNVALKGPLASIYAVKDISGVSVAWPQMIAGIVQGPRLPLGVRSLCPQGRTTSGAIEYLQELTFTDNANVVAEAAAKPKSDKTFGPATSVVRTIAHYFKVTKQTYEDIPQMASVIEANGIYGVQRKEDQQLLFGTGTAPELKGLMPGAAAAPAPPAGPPASTLVDAIGKAVFDLAAKGYVPDGTVANQADWGQVAMIKNVQGNYLFANPLDYTGGSRVWGTRLVLSSQMTAGNFLVGQFQGGCQIFDREDVNVQVANQNEDDFIKNMLTVLIEERLGFAIYQPSAFEKGVVPAVSLEAQSTL